MLADISFLIVLFGLTIYMIADGHGLGVGILTLAERDAATKARMTREVTFAWDANESWILLVALGLWATLPAVSALILPALYLPLFVMLFALIARGVSIELLNERGRFGGWAGLLFGLGSLVAVLMQGAAIGAILNGLPADPGGRFNGATFDWFSWYAVLAAVAAVALQALSGAVWTYYRAGGGELRARAAAWSRVLLPATVVLLALAWALLPAEATRLASGEHRTTVVIWAGVLGAIALAAVAAWVFQARDGGARPPVYLLALFKVAGVAGVAALVFPAVVPGALTLGGAAADDSSIWFFLVAAFLTLPVACIYNIYGYSVFGLRHRTARRGEEVS